MTGVQTCALPILSDVEVYEGILSKIGEDIEGNTAALGTLTALHQEITEAGQDPMTYSSQNLDTLQEKFSAVQELFEQKNAQVVAEREKQTANADLLKQFADSVAEYSSWTDEKKDAVNAELEGELDAQLNELRAQQTALVAESDAKLNDLAQLYAQLEQADVTEQSGVSLQALNILNDSLKTLIQKRVDAIQQQILQAKASNVSEEQMNEFRQTFKFFDKDHDDRLTKLDFKACLSSLGQDLPDEELNRVFASYDTSGDGFLAFEEFLDFMVKQSSQGQSFQDVLNAFTTLSGGQDFVTEAQLRGSGMSTEEVEFLIEKMPKHDNGFDYKAYLAQQFGEQ